MPAKGIPQNLTFIRSNDKGNIHANGSEMNPYIFKANFLLVGPHICFEIKDARGTGLKLKRSLANRISDEYLHLSFDPFFLIETQKQGLRPHGSAFGGRVGSTDVVHFYYDPKNKEYGCLEWLTNEDIKNLDRAATEYRILRRSTI